MKLFSNFGKNIVIFCEIINILAISHYYLFCIVLTFCIVQRLVNLHGGGGGVRNKQIVLPTIYLMGIRANLET